MSDEVLELISDSLVVKAVSPRATVEQTESGARISITDINGSTSVEVTNGVDGEVTKADFAEYTGQINAIDLRTKVRVTALDTNSLSVLGNMVTVLGIPPYIDDVTDYADSYGLTLSGWYVFARVMAPDGVSVGASTEIIGTAGYIAETGTGYVDVAIRFVTAPMDQHITINWGNYTDNFVFRATDLAVRNLDYRTTFYVYDIAPYTTWEYALTTDATFVADKAYYTKDGDTYTLAEVTTGEAVPADIYYNHSKVIFEGMPRNVTYSLDTPIDCPLEFKLPEIEDDGHGAWFEVQTRYTGSFSCTLTPPEGVKVGSTSTQSQTAGMNVIDLHYTNVNGYKMWTLLNTHTNLPTT